MTTLNITDANTIKGIAQDIESGKRTLKVIASECRVFEAQTDDEYASAIYARLSDCKTRAQFALVIKSI